VQVLLNLFKNTQDNFQIKDLKNNKIWISTTNIEDGVLISVYANGGGIEEEILPKIFDPYFSTNMIKMVQDWDFICQKLLLKNIMEEPFVLLTKMKVCAFIFLCIKKLKLSSRK